MAFAWLVVRMNYRRLARQWVLVAAIGGAFGLCGAGTAFGAVTEFGRSGENAGEFAQPVGVGVDETSGEVYVVDRNNARVDKFASEGEFQLAWGADVAHGGETLEVCTTRCFAGETGAASGQFSFPEGVAVNNDPFTSSFQDVYVYDVRNSRVQKFDSTGAFLLMFGGAVNQGTKGNVCRAEETCQEGTEGAGPGEFLSHGGNSIAIDASGTVYVGDENRIQMYDGEGIFESEVPLPGAGRVEQLAVDGSGDIYVKSSELSGVREYDGTGAEMAPVRDEAGNPSALAIGTAEELYVVDEQAGRHHILEFDAAGDQVASFDSRPESTSGSASLAYYKATKELYVLSSESVRVVTAPAPGPLVVPAPPPPATEVTPTSATVHGLVNPEGQEGTSYVVEYGTTAAYGSTTESVALGGSGFEDELASASLTGLQPSTTYHFRFVVTNAAAEVSEGPDQTFTTLPPVLIDSVSASDVTSTSAKLEARLNPLGTDTEYHFEYGLTTAYGNSVPVPDQDIGAGSVDVSLSSLVVGLAPDTSYHYRVVAHNALGTVESADQVFRTQGSGALGLTDGRSWEMVSPPNKQGVSLEAITEEGGVIQAGDGGNAITYISKASIVADPEGNRSIAPSQVLSVRDPGGQWSTQDIATPHETIVGLKPGFLSEYLLFSSDLSAGLVDPEGATRLAPDDPANTERTPYRREADGRFAPLVNADNVQPGTEFGGSEAEAFENGVRAVTATPDLSHVLLKSPQALTPGFTSGGISSLYEWSAGELELVSILPNGVPAAEEGQPSSVGTGNELVRGAISTDGSRVVFTAGTHLYMRDLTSGETVRIDTPEPGNKAETTPLFQAASSDGSKVFFTDASRLTDDSSANPGLGQRDLYMCQIQLVGEHLACALKDLSVPLERGEAADLRGPALGVDEAGQHVYFVANGSLASGATHGDCGEVGQELPPSNASCNLYTYDTSSEQLKLVAILANRDLPAAGVGGQNLGSVTTRVSPNGRYFAFMSQRSLTGYDNRDAQSGQPDEEVFLFDAGTSQIACVSCNATGARPKGVLAIEDFPGLLVDRPRLWRKQWLAGSIPGWTRVDLFHALYQSRYLSDSGRLFFNSADTLVPQDSNGKEDVYEFEPADVGSCELPSGCVSLMSSGTSSEESAFLDASSDGSDVFFLTAAKLAPQDVDDSLDLYDAHVCSAGAPCPPALASTPPPCGTADSCRAAPGPQVDLTAVPASATLAGAGNLQPPAGKPPVKKPPTRAQRLAKALTACQKKPRKKRAACRKNAHKRFGPVKHSVKAKKGRK